MKRLEVVHPMSVAIRGLSAAGAVALTLGIVTQPAGSAAQTRGHERATGGHLNRHVPVLQKPAEHFQKAIRRGDQRVQRIEAAHRAAAAKNDATSADSSGFPSPESVGVSSSTLETIAACESGGDPTAVSADGAYHGLYQFDYGTWASVGGSGDPAAASPAEQSYRAALLYSQSGSSPWPICGS
jgi:soluble lytic murein transglycosylase-like protein